MSFLLLIVRGIYICGDPVYRCVGFTFFLLRVLVLGLCWTFFFFFLTGGFGLSFWLILEDWLVFFSLWQYTKSVWVGFPLFHGRLIPKHVGTSSSIFNFKLNGSILLSFTNASLGYILIYYFKKNLMKKWVFVLTVFLILYKNFLKING